MIKTTSELFLGMENFKVKKCPPSSYYVPEFLTPQEEEGLLRNIYNVPKPKWTQLSNRRLQNWGGIPHVKGMIAEPIPQWLLSYMDKVTEIGIFGEKKPNHVLINEYQPNQGIMPHLDGPLYHPVIATLNLGSHTVLNFYDMNGERDRVAFSFFLEPRSLLVQNNEIYNNFMHGIEEKEVDIVNDFMVNLTADSNSQLLQKGSVKRETRISLTIRHVLKSSKMKIRL